MPRGKPSLPASFLLSQPVTPTPLLRAPWEFEFRVSSFEFFVIAVASGQKEGRNFSEFFQVRKSFVSRSSPLQRNILLFSAASRSPKERKKYIGFLASSQKKLLLEVPQSWKRKWVLCFKSLTFLTRIVIHTRISSVISSSRCDNSSSAEVPGRHQEITRESLQRVVLWSW